MAITDVQTPVGGFSTGVTSSFAKAYASNVTAGSLLVATVAWASGTQTCTVSGSLNGAFTAIVASLGQNATGGISAQIFYKVAGSSGAETVTATFSGTNSTQEISIYELAGYDAVNLPDSGNAATGNTSNPTASITTVAQPGRIISYLIANTGTTSAGAGYTSAVTQNGDTGEYKAYSSTGANSVPYVDASSTQFTITMAAFRDSGGVTGGTAQVVNATNIAVIQSSIW